MTTDATPTADDIRSQAMMSIEARIAAKRAITAAAVAPPSGSRISTKGKIFTLPDGRKAPGPLQVVILDWTVTNAWYKGVYNPTNPKPPACWSIGRDLAAMTPSPKSAEVQCSNCKECPMNQWKSAANAKGKACKNGRRLAVVEANFTADSQVYILEVSPKALNAFDGFVLKLDAAGLHPMEVVTTVGFVESEAYPVLTFSGAAKHDAAETAFALGEAAQAALFRGFDA